MKTALITCLAVLCLTGCSTLQVYDEPKKAENKKKFNGVPVTVCVEPCQNGKCKKWQTVYIKTSAFGARELQLTINTDGKLTNVHAKNSMTSLPEPILNLLLIAAGAAAER